MPAPRKTGPLLDNAARSRGVGFRGHRQVEQNVKRDRLRAGGMQIFGIRACIRRSQRATLSWIQPGGAEDSSISTMSASCEESPWAKLAGS